MPLITWEERFDVGVPAIDAQHRHLVQILNELHDAMRNGHANEVLGGLLDRLVSYTETHFTTEERLMKAVGYSDAAAHREQHQALIKQVRLLVIEWRSGRAALSMQVFGFLKTWLQGHILGSDQKYAAHIRASKPELLSAAR